MTVGVYPGSFNPFHAGHYNILLKAEKIKVISVSEQIGFAVAAINNQLSYEALKNLQHA